MPLRILLVLPLLFLNCLCSAQTTGALEGTVVDPAMAPVAHADVKVLQGGSSAARTVTTDSKGHWLIVGLPPGNCSLSVSVAGFKTAVETGLILRAGETTWAEVHLELGNYSEIVEISAQGSVLSASASQWGLDTERETLENLPLDGRDIFEMAAAQGASTVTNLNRAGFVGGFGLALSLNGGRPNQNGFRYDGLQVNDATNLPPVSAAGRSLGLESTQELSVVSSPFSAEYGRAAAAVITAISKSGGNSWHGSLFEYFRNDNLDAKNFFDAPDQAIPPFHRNQFGGMLSGPLVPNKLFFLINPEAVRQAQSLTVSAPSLTAAARQGFLPIPGEGTIQLPVSPIIQPFLQLYPLPNGRDYGDGTAEYSSVVPSTTDDGYLSAKLDAILNSQLRTAFRVALDRASAQTEDAYHWWTFQNKTHSDFVTSETQWVASPSMLHTFRVGVSRNWEFEIPNLNPGIPSSLSFIPGQPLGVLQVTGLEDYGSNNALISKLLLASTDLQFDYGFTYVHGRQSLKAGAGFSHSQTNPTLAVNTRGYYFFYSIESLLVNVPAAANLTTPSSDPSRTFSQDLGDVYAQYEDRLSSSLTLSAGVRYEPYTPPSERFGRVGQVQFPALSPMVVAGSNLYRNPSARNFAPRIALAWNPGASPKTVLRAGFGIFYDILGSTTYLGNRAYLPSQYRNITIPLPPFPNLLAAAAEPIPPFLETVDYEVQQPYVMQYQARLEHQLSSGTAAFAGYSGSRGVHLAGYVGDINTPSPQKLPDGQLYFAPGSPLMNPAFGQISMLRTQFNLFYNSLTAGLEKRWRKGLSLEVRYTLGRAIDETSSVLFQDFLNFDKIPNNFNYRANLGPADYNITHALGLNYSYSLPWKAGRGWHALYGGWAFAGIVQVQSGRPFNPHLGIDQAGVGSLDDLGQRPNLVPGAPVVLGGPDQYFNPQAFALPAAGTFGNLGRNSITGPGLFTLDAALHRALFTTDRQSLTLRVEAFNVTNHPNFQIPSQLALYNADGSAVGSAGQITETSTPSRQMQLALRWAF